MYKEYRNAERAGGNLIEISRGINFTGRLSKAGGAVKK